MEGSNKASPDDIENPRVPLLMESSMREESLLMESSMAMESSMREESLPVASSMSEESFRSFLNRFSPDDIEIAIATSPDDIEDPSVPLLATSIREKLGNLGKPLSPHCCIFRVPERLRHLNKKAYEPRVVSIGPLHHDKASRAMEEHKKRYLQQFLTRTSVSLENFLQKIRSQEAEIRSRYAETIDIGSDEFVEIILVDAIFILELLLRSSLKHVILPGDPIFGTPLMICDIWLDMLLLENQLPFFILKDLLDLHNTNDSSIILANLSLNFFDMPLKVRKAKEDRLKSVLSSDVEHFVDFMRRLCLPESLHTKELNTSINRTSITDLYQAGVTFEVVPNDTHLFDLDIKFTDGKLKIPKITIQDHTEVIIRNLIAFEQGTTLENYVTDYVVMMDRLVNAPEDVDLLVDSTIIGNQLGDSKAVSDLINDLGNGVNFDPSKFNYAAVCEGLSSYYNSACHKWKADLRQKYFNTPWATISVIAAVFLLILTFIQTVCSIISL